MRNMPLPFIAVMLFYAAGSVPVWARGLAEDGGVTVTAREEKPGSPEAAVSTAAPKASETPAAKTSPAEGSAAVAPHAGPDLMEPDFGPDSAGGFDEDFPAMNNADPFSMLEQLRRQMHSGLGRGAFAGGDMFASDGFKTAVSRTDKAVAVVIDVPGIDGKSLNLDINGGMIKMSYTARTISVQKQAGREYRSESSSSYMKIVPLPQDAVSGTGKPSVEKDRVVITFDRKR